ncbi:hypothetical protein OXB_1406 [Bacillus sp. OxB-1]|nr:hypothetical protein OXB_1406 [Bacillus sp. OxB-1]
MKYTVHLVVIIILVILTFLLYGNDLGAIPFLLAAIYLIYISVLEFRQFRRSKRL